MLNKITITITITCQTVSEVLPPYAHERVLFFCCPCFQEEKMKARLTSNQPPSYVLKLLHEVLLISYEAKLPDTIIPSHVKASLYSFCHVNFLFS
jgi:hypothetical protein